MTISIVARDPASGRFGVATASFALAVGARVPHVRGHGALAVQAGSPATWGPVVLAALESGVRASEAVRLLGSTPAAERSQLAVVDRFGGAAVLSGTGLDPDSSDAGRPGVCAAAHQMERRGVARVAVHNYETSSSPTFEGRLLDALSAADRMGGDVRGRQSAALRTVSPGQDEIDLRVDDARDPVGELRRLGRLASAHVLLAASRDPDGDHRDADLALAALDLAPDDLACLGGAALALVRSARIAEATPLLRRLSAREPRTAVRIHRLIQSGRLAEQPGRAVLRVIDAEGDPNRTSPAGLPVPYPAGAPTPAAGLALARSGPNDETQQIPVRPVPAAGPAPVVRASTPARPAG